MLSLKCRKPSKAVIKKVKEIERNLLSRDPRKNNILDKPTFKAYVDSKFAESCSPLKMAGASTKAKFDSLARFIALSASKPSSSTLFSALTWKKADQDLLLKIWEDK